MLGFFFDYLATFWSIVGATRLYDKITSTLEITGKVYTNVIINQLFVILPMYYFGTQFAQDKPILDPRNVYRIPLFFVLYELYSYYVHVFQHYFVFLRQRHNLHERGPIASITSCYGHPLDIFLKNISLFLSAYSANVSCSTFRLLNIFMVIYDTAILHGKHGFYFHRMHHMNDTGKFGMMPLIDMDDVHST